MGEEQTTESTDVPKEKLFKWYDLIILSVIVTLLGSAIWWLNSSEEYNLVKADARFADEGKPSCRGSIDFHCDISGDVTIITVLLSEVSVQKRDDGQNFTSVCFSDTDCVAQDLGDRCLNLRCARRGPEGHLGKSAEILVPCDEDLIIWNNHLAELRKRESANHLRPARVLPQSDTKSVVESASGK